MRAPFRHALLVDTDHADLKTLEGIVLAEGLTASTASTLRAARDLLENHQPDVALVNASLPDGEGLSLLRTAQQTGTRMILIAETASIEAAIEAVRLGVYEYLQKPLDAGRVRTLLATETWPRTLSARDEPPRSMLQRHPDHLGALLGTSLCMQRLFDLIEKAAPTDVSIFITGESGTGKDLVAQTIHQFSKRHDAEFLSINCSAVSASLIESELFGHERGSFPGATRRCRGYFECANGGTLFLDEITEMPIELQARLLRILESGFVTRLGGDHRIPVDVHIISTTSRNVNEAVAAGMLREDLLYRLNVFPLHLPPLRERQEDVPLLTQHFLNLLNQGSKTGKLFAPEALEHLQNHNWPGNVRELRNVVHRAFILADDVIGLEHLPSNSNAGLQLGSDSLSIRIGTALAEAERRLILATLIQCRGNKRQAAEMLEISLKTLYNRLNAYRYN